MFQHTQSNATPAIPGAVSAGQDGRISRLAHAIKSRERPLSDVGVYALAIAGFWVSYQVTFALCIKHNMPHDQAVVVAGLADFAQLVYSIKALHATEDGRSAWVIRLFVITLSLSSFAMNVRDAWPHPTDLGIWGLAPAVWISAHEFMLHGKRKAIKAKIKADKIARGLLPAPIAKIGLTPFLLAPLPVFRVKRIMLLTGCTPTQAANLLIQRAKTKGKRKIPFAWTALIQREALLAQLVTETIERDPEPPQPKQPIPAQAAPAMLGVRKPPTVKQIPAQAALPQNAPTPVRLASVDIEGNTPLAKLPEALRHELLAAIPEKSGPRSKDQTVDLYLIIEKICHAHGAECTGKLAAQLLEIGPSVISRYKDAIDAARTSQLAATGS